jgi:hypothetical protein
MPQIQTNNEHSEDSSPINISASQTSHVLFGSLMKESLIPLNLEVETDYEVGKGPPKLDVLIIRRKGTKWSKTQLDYLSDGIRQSTCKHVIVELKYTESINKIGVFQTIGYLGSYIRLKKLQPDKVCAFIVSSKTPQQKVLDQIGFVKMNINGVYRSKDCLLSQIQLISLNELSNEPYNLWIKLFASKINQRVSVLKKILSLKFEMFNRDLFLVLFKILNEWTMIGEVSMQKINQDILSKPDLNDELKAWILSSFFKPEERLHGLKPEEVLSEYKPEDILKGLDLKIIEDYVRKQRKMKR